MHEAGCPGQPGFSGWFLRGISNNCCWEQNRVGHGQKYAGWAGSSGECCWARPPAKECTEACCEWAGLPGCPGHVSISGRCCVTFGLHLPVQLYWLIWLLFDLAKSRFTFMYKFKMSSCFTLFAVIHNLPLIFLSLLTVFHTAVASGMQSPKNNKHANNKVRLSSWLVLLAHFLSLIIFF